MKKFLVTAGFVFLFFSSTTKAAFAATYYLATNGNDSNPGSSSAPYRTFLKAINSMAGGDTLIVRSGIYEEALTQDTDDVSKRVKIPSGISQSQPTVIRSEVKRGAVIRPKDGRFVLTLGTSGEKDAQGKRYKADKYITIDGFVLDGTNIRNDAVRITGASETIPTAPITSWQEAQPGYISIINNHIKNAAGFWRRIEASTIDYNSPIDVTGSSGGKGSATKANYHPYGMGISASHTNNIYYANNILENNGMTDFDHGIYTYGRFGTIEGNISFHNRGTGIKVGWGNVEGIVVRNNISFDNNASALARGKNNSLPGWEGRGISTHRGKNIQIYNNVVWGAHQVGIDAIYDISDVKVYNNTVYVTGDNGTSHGVQAGPSSNNIAIKNNIIYQGGIKPASYYNNAVNVSGANVSVENNLFFGKNTNVSNLSGGLISNKNNIVADPKFVSTPPANATLDQAINFAKGLSLQSSSPAINKGASLAEVTTDFSNVRRPVGGVYDIGAFEFGGVPAPQPPAPQPAPPNAPPPPPPPAGSTPSTTAAPGVKTGDANRDNKVDNADYTIWAGEFKSKTGSSSDFNKDGRVDGVDFTLWLINYGK